MKDNNDAARRENKKALPRFRLCPSAYNLCIRSESLATAPAPCLPACLPAAMLPHSLKM